MNFCGLYCSWARLLERWRNLFCQKRNIGAFRDSSEYLYKTNWYLRNHHSHANPWERQVTSRVYRKLLLCAIQVSRVSLLTTNLKTILPILIKYFTKILQIRVSVAILEKGFILKSNWNESCSTRSVFWYP